MAQSDTKRVQFSSLAPFAQQKRQLGSKFAPKSDVASVIVCRVYTCVCDSSSNRERIYL